MATPTPQPGILDIDLYVGGQSTLAGHKDVLKLSSNESPYGPPPAAQQALRGLLRRGCTATRPPTTPPCAPPLGRCIALIQTVSSVGLGLTKCLAGWQGPMQVWGMR